MLFTRWMLFVKWTQYLTLCFWPIWLYLSLFAASKVESVQSRKSCRFCSGFSVSAINMSLTPVAVSAGVGMGVVGTCSRRPSPLNTHKHTPLSASEGRLLLPGCGVPLSVRVAVSGSQWMCARAVGPTVGCVSGLGRQTTLTSDALFSPWSDGNSEEMSVNQVALTLLALCGLAAVGSGEFYSGFFVSRTGHRLLSLTVMAICVCMCVCGRARVCVKPSQRRPRYAELARPRISFVCLLCGLIPRLLSFDQTNKQANTDAFIVDIAIGS